jgi:dihydropteroate synthase
MKFKSGRVLTLEPWCLMGILNATPDSFSDGGLHLDPADGLCAGLRMLEEGASILDVGGESTRPGAQRVGADIQCQRVLPLIERLRAETDAIVSIDTTLAEVAGRAIEAGADVINDVAAGQEDPRIFDVAAESGSGLVLMHRRVPPEMDQYSTAYETNPVYEDVVQDVCEFLTTRAKAAQSRGVDKDKIIVDPGFGFGKSVEQNLALLEGIDAVVALGYPVLAGLSRKSFLGSLGYGADPAERVEGSVVLGVRAWERGANILRVHDPAPHHEALLRSSFIPTSYQQ